MSRSRSLFAHLDRTSAGGVAQSELWRDTDRGDTLVEVLVAVVIIGITVVAVLGALLTTTSASVQHRNSTNFATYLASFAESARQAVEFQAYNGSSSGPAFVACTSSYSIVGSPIPKSGPVGSSVAVLGTGFTPTGGVFTGATFNGTTMSPLPSAINSSASGDIAQFTVPTLPAGRYQVTPFSSSPQAATTFAITPWVGAMSPNGVGVGPGSAVKVSVTGFAASSPLTVTVGSNPPVSASPNTGTNGSATVHFTIPNPLAGSHITQLVTISDGTNTSTPIVLSVTTDTSPSNPPYNVPSFNTYETLTSSLSYWNSSVVGGWTSNPADCTGSNYNPNIQQLKLDLVDNQPNNGAGAVQTIDLANFDPQGLSAPPAGLTASTPTAALGAGKIALTWFPPTYHGTSALTTFKVYRSTTSGSFTGPPITTVAYSSTASSYSYTDTGLSNGNLYYYQVTAMNGIGESQPSTQASASTLPGAPSGLSAIGGIGQVALSWSAPSPNGDSTITGYNVYRSTTSGGPWGPSLNGGTPVATTSYTDSSVANGTIYYYEVTAVNSGGEGPASSQATATTRPGAPSSLTASAGNAQVMLSWIAPSPNGNAPIAGYNVYRSTTSGGPWGTPLNGGTPVATTSYTDSAVTNGTTYYYEVKAANSGGEGPASNQASATAGAPSAPTNLTASTPSHTSVTLTWIAPANNGSTITKYIIYRSTDGSQGSPVATLMGNPPATTYTDTGLTHNTTYYYEVVAVNANGQGPPSNQVQAKP